jgi:hypothetical protein
MTKSKTNRYLLTASACALFLLVLELGFNCLVDPLFFMGGNRITGKGYYMNERISVIAFNRHRWPKVDCLIFGSSRSTFLDASKISGYTCANIAFSGGLVDEFAVYARYLKAQGVAPKLVIFGVDNYESSMTLKDVPDFIKNSGNLPGWLTYYSSLDTLRFSIDALMGLASPNYYDRNYRKYIGFALRRPGEEHAQDRFYVNPGLEDAVTARIPYYQNLCAIFPKARCVGFVPPISTWGIEKALNLGTTPYLKSMEALAHVFDSFYDFSVLANPQWDFADSSDGIHFSAKVFDRVAAKIANPTSENWGFDVKALAPATYEQLYNEAAGKAVADRKLLNQPR